MLKSEVLTENVPKLISVIVPFRNEESTINEIIMHLVAQKSSCNNFEAILVDDHSTDESFRIAAESIKTFSNFRLISLPPGEEGKKKAITLGIENSIGEIIVTTDADCLPQSTWLCSMQRNFLDNNVKMVFGGVRITDDEGFFSKLQALEFSSLIGVSAASASLGYPTMCNGANLAFVKSAFFEVEGYEGNFEIPSGDDEFLMRKIGKKFKQSIRFISDSRSVVATHPQKSLRSFIAQRLRWAGKWKYNDSVFTKLLAVFILLFQIAFLAVIGLFIAGKLEMKAALFLVGTKIVLEFILLSKVCSFLQTGWRTFYFLLLQFIYPLYVLVIGVASNFIAYSWKERAIFSK